MPMWVDRYRPVWAVPAVRRAVALGFLVRMPMFTIGILVTIHVVTALGRSYTAAGVAAIYGPGTNIPHAAHEILEIVQRQRKAAHEQQQRADQHQAEQQVDQRDVVLPRVLVEERAHVPPA